MSFCLIMWACLTCGLSLEQHSKRKLLSWLPAMQRHQVAEKWGGQAQRHTVQHSLDRLVKHWKKASSSLYLDELLIQKCKFRDRFTSQILAWKGFPRRVHTTLTKPVWSTHTCSEIAYRITDVECIVRAKTPQLNLTGSGEWLGARNSV